ncbi:hypothetical protein GOODEAATRI_010850 [Goodea atripinnis]|uniref:Secreted protein n=1 Tax=Goodea atripinnis TaxID=208336 RepID=A0ABV0PMZ1_9TELE
MDVNAAASGYLLFSCYLQQCSSSARVKRPSRTFLQNRLRGPYDRQQPSSRQWTGIRMCWIRGSLYRVSANKLSRTVTPQTSIDRRGTSGQEPHI